MTEFTGVANPAELLLQTLKCSKINSDSNETFEQHMDIMKKDYFFFPGKVTR